jgi:hypothetical protein
VWRPGAQGDQIFAAFQLQRAVEASANPGRQPTRLADAAAGNQDGIVIMNGDFP